MPNFMKTKLKRYEIEDLCFDKRKNPNPTAEDEMIGSILKCKNGPEIRSNLSLLTAKQKSSPFLSYFIIDRDDYVGYLRFLQRTGKRNGEIGEILSFNTFSRNVNKKQFYMRDLGNGQFFPEELLNLIPMVLEVQGGRLDRELFKLFQELYKRQNAAVYNTITLQELNEALDAFGIDKSSVKIVPDIGLANSKSRMQEDYTELMRTWAPGGELVINVSLVILRTHLSRVIQHPWEQLEDDEEVANCRRIVISTMDNYIRLNQNAFISCQRTANVFTMNTSPQESMSLRPFLEVRNAVEIDYLGIYQLYCARFDLPVYPNSWWNENRNRIPLWLMRLFLVAGWWQKFAPDRVDIKRELIEAMAITFMLDHEDESKLEKIMDLLMNYEHQPEPVNLETKELATKIVEMMKSGSKLQQEGSPPETKQCEVPNCKKENPPSRPSRAPEKSKAKLVQESPSSSMKPPSDLQLVTPEPVDLKPSRQNDAHKDRIPKKKLKKRIKFLEKEVMTLQNLMEENNPQTTMKLLVGSAKPIATQNKSSSDPAERSLYGGSPWRCATPKEGASSSKPTTSSCNPARSGKQKSKLRKPDSDGSTLKSEGSRGVAPSSPGTFIT